MTTLTAQRCPARHRGYWLHLISLLIACAGPACSTVPIGVAAEPQVIVVRNRSEVAADPGQVLEGGPWLLLELNSMVVQLPAGERHPYLQFRQQDNRVAGYSGCNELTGSFAVQGNSLTIGPLGMTRRFCADAAGEVEQVFLTVLSKVSGWRIEQQMLLLMDSDRVVARLRQERLPAPP